MQPSIEMLLVAVCLLLLLCVGWCQRRGWLLIWQLNGWRGVLQQPILWLLLFVHLDPKTIINAVQGRRGFFARPLGILVGTRVWLYADDPITIERLLNTPECLDKSFLQDGFYIRRGLLHARGDKWKPRRKQLNPAFNHNILLSFFDIFNTVGNELVQKFDTDLRGDAVAYRDVEGLISRAVLEVSCQTTMGTETNLTKQDTQRIARTYRRLVELSALRVVKPWLQIDLLFRLLDRKNYEDSIRINKLVEQFVCNMVQRKHAEWLAQKQKHQHQQQRRQSSGAAAAQSDAGCVTGGDAAVLGAHSSATTHKRIFIEQIFHLADTGELTLQDIMDESSSMVMVSFETISSCLIIALLCLAMHDDCQRKLRHEINETLAASNADSPSATVCRITAAQLLQMKYLEMIVHETLRLLPTVPFNIRQASRDFALPLTATPGGPSGVAHVPAGSVIVIDTFSLQRDAAHWGPHAQHFHPEHFSESQQSRQRHAYAFIPFSKGLRYCIGNRYTVLLTKMLLAKLIFHFEFATATKLQDLRFIEGISLKLHNSDNIRLQIRRVGERPIGDAKPSGKRPMDGTTRRQREAADE